MTRHRVWAAAALGLTPFLAAHASPAVPDNVAYITNQGGGVTILDTRSLQSVGSIDSGPDPRGLAITPDGRHLLTANQGTSDVSVVDATTREVIKRIPVGKNVEFMRVSPDGKRAFVTYEPSSRGAPPAPAEGKSDKHGTKDGGKDDDDDNLTPAEVAVIDLKTWRVVGRMRAAPETEGIEFTPDGKSMVVANEGNNTIAVYSLATMKLTRTIDISKHGDRPRGVKLAPDGQSYIVTMENSNSFLQLDAKYKVLRSVPTGTGPYGAAYAPDGKTLWIAASRAGRLQVFDAATLASVADIPVGKRCWHFSFTPDASRVLLACGRSNDVQVIDTTSLKVVETLPGYQMPWGVVTYPKTNGSLDAAPPTGTKP